MDKLEILRQAKQKVDALVAEKRREETDDAGEKDSAYLAVLMTATDSIIEAIEGSKVNEERIAEAVRAEIEKIRLPDTVVNVPELKLPVFNVPRSEIEVKIPDIVVPEPKVTVNIPKMEAPVVNIPPFPEIKMPDSMEIHGDVGLFGYGFDNPLPVQLRDAKGNPVDLGGMVGGQVSGGGGRFVKVTNDADSPIPITGSITSSPGATYYASDAVGSVNVIQSVPISISDVFGSTGTNVINPDGRVKVELPSGASGLTDTELRASSLLVDQLSGANWSVYLTGATGTVGVVTINPDGLPVYGGSSGGGLTDTELRASSVPVEQVSGSIWSTNVTTMPAVVVTSITNSTAVSILNGDGVALDPRNRNWTITETVPVSGTFYQATQPVSATDLDIRNLSSGTDSVTTVPSGTQTVSGTVAVSGITASTASSIVDSSGIQYSGSNPVPVTLISGALSSTGAYLLNGDGTYRDSMPVTGTVTVSSITASTASALVDSTGVQYSGSNPVPIKEINPSTGTNTSVADSATSVTILASNTARRGATVYNDSSATLYLLLGATTATTTNYTCKVVSSGYYEVPFGYTGQLTGIWASDPGDGGARVTEIT